MVERGGGGGRKDPERVGVRPSVARDLYLGSMPPASTPTPPLLSIVTPVRDQARFLSRSLASVRDQPPGIAEHIVMDGQSVDGGVEILRDTPGLSSWTSGPDRGQSHAINEGFARARGVFGGWLNADDWYIPGVLGDVADFFREHPETDILVGRARFVAEDGRIIHEPTPPERIDEPSLLSLRSGWFAGHSIAQPEVFFRLEMFRAVGGLGELNHHSMDHHLWLKLIERGARVRQLDRVIACQGVHAGQKTADRLAATRSIVASSRTWLDRRGSHWPLRAPEVRKEIEALERKLALATRYVGAIDRALSDPLDSGGFVSASDPTPQAWTESLRSVVRGLACGTGPTVVVTDATNAEEIARAIGGEASCTIARSEELSRVAARSAACVVLHRVLGGRKDPAGLVRAAISLLAGEGSLVISAEPERSDTHDNYLKRLRTRAVNKVTQPDDFVIGPRPDAVLRPMLELPGTLAMEAHPNPRGIDVDALLRAAGGGARLVASERFGGFDNLPLAPFAAPHKMTPHGPDGGVHHCWRTCAFRVG